MLKAVQAILKDAPSMLGEMAGGLLWPVNAPLGWTIGNLEKWGPAQWVKAIEVLAVLIAVLVFTIEMSDRGEERTARAWQLVTTAAPGNSGKIQALEYLNSQDSEWLLRWWPYAKKRTSLEGIDLTPPMLAEQWKGKEGSDRTIDWRECPDRTYLVGVKLPNVQLSNAKLPCADLFWAKLGGANLNKVDLRGANLFGADLRGASFFGTDLRRVDLSSADLRGATFFGTDLRGVDLSSADLSGAHLLGNVKLHGAIFLMTDLSGTDFLYARGAPDLSISCADPNNPPIRLPENVKLPQVWKPCWSEKGN